MNPGLVDDLHDGPCVCVCWDSCSCIWAKSSSECPAVRPCFPQFDLAYIRGSSYLVLNLPALTVFGPLCRPHLLRATWPFEWPRSEAFTGDRSRFNHPAGLGSALIIRQEADPNWSIIIYYHLQYWRKEGGLIDWMILTYNTVWRGHALILAH